MSEPSSGLTGPEERLIQLIREGRLDAEIAVRLGVSVGDIKDRTERLLRKLDLPNRAALAAWQPGSAPAAEPKPAEPRPAATTPDPQEPAESPSIRRRWLPIAAGTAVVALVVAGVAAIAFILGGSESADPPASETQEPATTVEPEEPSPVAFTVGGVEPLTTTGTSTSWGEAYWVLVTTGGCFTCDGPPTGLTRVSYWTDGQWSVEDKFEVPDGWTMTGIEASATGYSLVITLCQSQTAEPCANALPEVPVLSQVWQSADGGVTWDLLTEVDRSVTVVAVTGGGPLLRSKTADQTYTDEVALPNGNGSTVESDYRILGVTFTGDSIEAEGVDLAGQQIVETGPIIRRPLGNTQQDPSFEIPTINGGIAFEYFDSADGEFYYLSIAEPGSPDNPAAEYVAKVDASTVKVEGVWEANRGQIDAIALSSRGTAQGLGVIRNPGNPVPFLPAVFQFDARQFAPLFGYWEAAFSDDVLTVVAGSLGPFVRVSFLDGPDDCLNLRSAPSTNSEIRGCFPEGTFLRQRSDEVVTDDGWMPVTAPDGQPVWASMDFLSLVVVPAS